jgi:steroid delta-isomerase-like uncharacterized protein
MNVAWAKEWAANFTNVDKLIEMYADDAKFEDVVIAHKEEGKAEIKKFFVAAGNPAYAQNTIVAIGYSGNADGGVVEWTWEAKHAGGRILNVPAKGKQTNTRGASALTFKNGKITSQRDYWDAAAILRQLGAIK